MVNSKHLEECAIREMAAILSVRMQKCSHIEGAINVLRPFANGLSMRDVCLQHHPPLDKTKQSATKTDFVIHGRKDEKEVGISTTFSFDFVCFVRFGENAIFRTQTGLQVSRFLTLSSWKKVVLWTRTLVNMSRSTKPTLFPILPCPTLYWPGTLRVGGIVKFGYVQGNLCPIFFRVLTFFSAHLELPRNSEGYAAQKERTYDIA